MDLWYYLIFVIMFISAFFIIFTSDAYVKRIEIGKIDMNVLTLIFIFFIIIMMAVVFVFARLPSARYF